ncbi:MAG: FeoB-associated Cys-rich membrane protein [Clostridia bacterium]|nr:FeoB-associated Cys-rich membrane protein [Clostridia bacterium]
MFAWIAANAATVIVTAVLLLLIGAAVLTLVFDKRNKKGACTGNCASCGMCCSYVKEKKTDEK